MTIETWSSSGHIRLNKATREWVIYAPSRRKRPQDFQQKQAKKLPLPDFLSHCPFCPGQESDLEPIKYEIRNEDQSQWLIRVVPNKFPALFPLETWQRNSYGIYLTLPGYGQHEVILESPYHNDEIATMNVSQVELVVETYHQRYLDLMKTKDTMMVIIFRNHGQRAGASLQHPHSQIISTGVVPQSRRWQEEEAQRYFDEWGHCVYCDMLDFELKEKRRIVTQNESFVAFIPFAAEVPFEIWIMPLRHTADFGSITLTEKKDFAFILKDVLGRLYCKLNDPDYNYVIKTAARYRAEEPQLHWYCQITPRLTTRAGFELGSGISINPSIPESDAEFLRESSIL